MKHGIQKVLDFIEKNFTKQISVAEAAELSGYSYHHFCRLFKTETGETFIQRLQRLRVGYALELLQVSPDPVHEIARQAGFSNVLYFHRVFRSLVNDTPMQYRRKAFIESGNR